MLSLRRRAFVSVLLVLMQWSLVGLIVLSDPQPEEWWYGPCIWLADGDIASRLIGMTSVVGVSLAILAVVCRPRDASIVIATVALFGWLWCGLIAAGIAAV